MGSGHQRVSFLKVLKLIFHCNSDNFTGPRMTVASMRKSLYSTFDIDRTANNNLSVLLV